jgi:endonuclease YncB( thermonuclease family)
MRYLFFILCLVSFSVNASTLNQYQIIRVIDGDTIVFRADFLPDPLKKELALRIYGVDTPEKGHRASFSREQSLGNRASDFTLRKIREATNIRIELKSWDKYGGRVLGDAYLDGKSLRSMLLTEGFAREYFGDKKKSWCD